MTSRWSHLVATALVGTGRRPLPRDAAEPWAVVGDPDETDDGARLLDLAAGYRTALRTGRRAPTVEEPPRPPAGQPAPAPASAQRLLEELLSVPCSPEVAAWLEICSDRGRTVAPSLWPALADHLVRHLCAPAAAVGAALGPHGRWLLGCNPRWAPVLAQLRSAEPDAGPVDDAAAQARSAREAVEHAFGDLADVGRLATSDDRRVP
jgi:hypothetical protein